MKKHKNEFKFIYNPYAGEKRKMIPGTYSVSLEEVKSLLKKYQAKVHSCTPKIVLWVP